LGTKAAGPQPMPVEISFNGLAGTEALAQY
jgi:hypothetical protein